MKKSLVALALVAGCGASDHQGGNAAAPAGSGRAGQGGSTVAARSAPGGDPLVGLWEGGTAGQRSQLCITPKGDAHQFGITVRGGGLTDICSGAGLVERQGDRLSLTMTGDSACTVTGRIEGTTVTLADASSQGCAYYCSKTARFSGAFRRTGSTAADAARAKDLAADPLCG